MLIPAVHPGAVTVRNVPLLLIPSLSDCLFLAILVWVFAAGSGWSVLLADGDTGWHIRTGEYILDTRAVPVRDLFSFSKAGQPWFAWEWLSDVIFALLHRAWGLKGVVAFTGLVLSFSSALLYRYMMWRGAGDPPCGVSGRLHFVGLCERGPVSRWQSFEITDRHEIFLEHWNGQPNFPRLRRSFVSVIIYLRNLAGIL